MLAKPLISLISALLITLGFPISNTAQPPAADPTPAIEWTEDSLKWLVKTEAAELGWTGPEWTCLTRLIGKESAWNYQADNPNSSAYGLFQILKTPENLSPEDQTDRGLRYIAHRYNTPCRALAFWEEMDRRGVPWY